MIGARRLAQARHVGQRGQADVAAVGHHPQALAHQRPVDAGQRHDIAHSPQGDEVEPLAQVGLGACRAVPARLAQGAIDADRQQESHAHRRHLLVRAVVVQAIGIDHGHRLRQRDLRHVMVDDDQVEAHALRLGQRLEGGDAAIDRDHDRGALLLDAEQRRRIGAVAFLAPVGNVDGDVAADGPEEARQQRRRGGAVDVVVAEHHDLLALADRAHDARDGGVHVLEMRGIGQELAQGGLEEVRHAFEIDLARRQQAADRVGQAMALRHGKRHPLVGQPGRPPPAGERALDAEEGCTRGAELRRHVPP